jgi:hypothetical protein
MNQLKFTNTNYPDLVGHSVKVVRESPESVCLLFLTGKCRGIYYVCPPDNIGPVAQRKPLRMTTLDYLIEFWHSRIAA